MKTMRSTILVWLVAGIATFAAGSDEKQKGTGQENCVVMTYRKPVENYDVTVFWRPWEQMAGFLIGPAILEFRHRDPSKTFAVTNNRFGLPNSMDWIKSATIKDGYFLKTSRPRIVMDYVEPQITDQLPEASFFFVDLTFDGRKELVMTEIANGQRWRHAYQVHDINSVGNSKPTAITHQEPFVSLDSQSRIDFKNRTILLNNSNGAADSQTLLYKFDEKQEQYILVRR